MFSVVGKKIKDMSKKLFVIWCIGGIIGAVVLGMLMYEIFEKFMSAILIGITAGVFNIIVSYVITLALYSYGDIQDKIVYIYATLDDTFSLLCETLLIDNVIMVDTNKEENNTGVDKN